MPNRPLFAACVAAVAAGLAASSCAKKKTEPVPAAEAHDVTAQEVRCEGVNACKGQSACHTAESTCAGQNACKGKGWVAMAAKDCEKKGGKAGAGPAKM
jgi:hypothetical protein